MIRRHGDPIRKQPYRIRPGVYAILWRGRSLLLTHQQEPTPEFQLPGGGIDPGESPLGALHREVLEETGWRIARPRRIGAFRSFTYMPEYDLWAEKLCHVYLARPVRPHGPPAEAGHRSVWMTPELARDLLADDGNRAFVEKMFF